MYNGGWRDPHWRRGTRGRGELRGKNCSNCKTLRIASGPEEFWQESEGGKIKQITLGTQVKARCPLHLRDSNDGCTEDLFLLALLRILVRLILAGLIVLNRGNRSSSVEPGKIALEGIDPSLLLVAAHGLVLLRLGGRVTGNWGNVLVIHDVGNILLHEIKKQQ